MHNMALPTGIDKAGRILIVLVWLVLLVSCGGGGGDSSSDTSQSGSLSFTLVFVDPNNQATREFAEGGDICVTHGIEEIHATLSKMDGTFEAQGSWPCSEHRGVLDDVKPASDLVVSVTGKVDGEVQWKGQMAGIEVVAEEITQAGTITMVMVVDDSINPQISSKEPDDGAIGIAVGTAITVHFNEPVSVISLHEALDLIDDESSAIECTVSYYADHSAQIWRATYTPASSLRPGVEYTVTLLSHVEDLAGNSLDEVTWIFATSTDTYPGLIWGQHNWGEANWQ